MHHVLLLSPAGRTHARYQAPDGGTGSAWLQRLVWTTWTREADLGVAERTAEDLRASCPLQPHDDVRVLDGHEAALLDGTEVLR